MLLLQHCRENAAQLLWSPLLLGNGLIIRVFLFFIYIRGRVVFSLLSSKFVFRGLYNWQNLRNTTLGFNEIHPVWCVHTLEWNLWHKWIFTPSVFTWNVNSMRIWLVFLVGGATLVLSATVCTIHSHVSECLASLRSLFNQILCAAAVWGAVRCLLTCWKLIILGTSTDPAQICQKS